MRLSTNACCGIGEAVKRVIPRIIDLGETSAETSLDLVKRRPPDPRRFYSMEPAMPWVYILITSHVLARFANILPLTAYGSTL